jgi:hypothetical protein
MRCKKAKKWISDRIDGKLSDEKQAILKSHLAGCASCRAYQERLENIQKESLGLFFPRVAPEYWQESILRLKAGLQAGKGAGIKVKEIRSPSFIFNRRWAWAGAAAFLVIAVGLYVLLSSPKAPSETMAFSFEDTMNRMDQEIGYNPELENDLNSIIQDSIYENIGEIQEIGNPFHYENPLFLESLNEEELQALDSAIQDALKL